METDATQLLFVGRHSLAERLESSLLATGDFPFQYTSAKDFPDQCHAADIVFIDSDSYRSPSNIPWKNLERSQTVLIVPEGSEKQGMDFIRQGGDDFICANHLDGPYFERLLHNLLKMHRCRERTSGAEAAASAFKGILDYVKYIVTIWGSDLRCVYANTATIEHNKRDLVGVHFKDIIKTPEGYEVWTERIRKVFESGEPIHISNEDGFFMYERSLVPLRNASGKVAAIAWIHQGTNQQREADKEKRIAENLYRAIVEDQLEFVSRFDLDLRLTYVNKALCRYVDRTPEELLGQTFLQWIIEEDREKIAKAISDLSYENQFYKGEQRTYGADGQIRWQEWTNRLLFDKSGQPLYYQAIGRDITDRKIAEELLRESEEKYRTLFNGAADSILIVDAQSRAIIEFNDSALTTFGYGRAEFTNMPVFNLAGHRNPETTRSHFAKVLGEGSETYESEFLRKDGEIRHVIVSAHSIALSSKQYIIAIIHDITERKKMEEDLAREKSQLYTLLDNLPDHIYYKDLQGRFILVNRKMMEDAGASSLESIIGKTDFDFLAHNFAETYRQEEEEIYRSRKPIINSEQVWIDPYQKPHVLLISKIPIFDISNQPIGIVGIARDITRIREAEDALKRSEQRFRQVMEVSYNTLYHRSLPTGVCEYISPSCERNTGFSLEESMRSTFEEALERLWPPHREVVQKKITALTMEPHNPDDRFLHFEYLWKHKDGSYRWFDENAVVVCDDEGKPTALVGDIRDITEKKLSEQQIEEMLNQIEKSRDDMLSILDQLRIGVLLTNEEQKILFVSQQFQNLLSLRDNQILGHSWKFVLPLPREDQDKLDAMAQENAASRSKVAVHVELQGRRHHWMEVDIHDDPRDPRAKIYFFYDVSEIHDLRRQLDEKGRFQDLIGRSKQMRTVFEQIQEVSQVDWTVLIEGDTGTGKELVARAIHFSSPRKAKPFIALNCAGLSDSLLASQLFGHKKGAFTGASENHQGLFEAADGGTLFLDEIGDIPMNVQTSLLRVLQEKEITRLGESKPRKIDVRVLAATNRDLNLEVARGNFRLDLLYRVRITRIHIPPLRARAEDIPLLVGWFLGQCRAASGKTVEQLSPDAMRALLDYAWPGNVRELQNAIEYAVIRCQQSVIQKEDLPPEIISQTVVITPWLETVTDEKERFILALKQTHGNRKDAANLLGISRATFYRRLDQYGLQDEVH